MSVTVISVYTQCVRTRMQYLLSGSDFILLQIFYFEKIRVFKAGVTLPLNILAWDNEIRLLPYSRWFF